MCDLQIFCHSCPRLLRQLIQSSQCIFDICSSYKPFHEFLCFKVRTPESLHVSNMLTNRVLLQLLCRKGEYQEHLCHDLAEHRYHVHGERNAGMDDQTCEECLKSFKKIDKKRTACFEVLSNLWDLLSQETHNKESEQKLHREGCRSQ
jgi:hypothetical protein